MNKYVARSIAGLAVVGLAAGGYAAYSKGGAKKVDEVTYETAKAERGDVRSSVSATGTIQAWKTVDVKSDVAGRIMKLYVDLGYTVHKGDPIADIDPTDTQAALQQAEADINSARAKKAQAEVSVAQQRDQANAHVASATRAVAAAEARMAQASATQKAQPGLTDSAIAEARANLASANKAVLQARNNKAQLEEQLRTLQDVTIPLNISTVESNVSQAVANQDTLQKDYVRQRDLLAQGYVAKSDVETAYSKLAAAKASVRTSQQRLTTLKRENQLSVSQLKAQIDEAQAGIEAAEAKVEQAKAQVKTAEQNTYQNDVRDKEYAAAKASYEQAKADLSAAKAELKLVDVKKQDIAQAEEAIKRSDATYQQAKTNRGYTRVIASRDGVVVTKNVEEGTVVPSSKSSVGTTGALVQLGDVTTMWVVCQVDETDIASVKVGQKVDVKVEAYPDDKVRGKVIRIDPQAIVTQNVTTVPVTVQIEHPLPKYKPLMNATCEFINGERKDVLTVPNEAVHQRQGTYTVQVMQPNHQPKDVDVEVGLQGQDTTEVTSGLNEGDEVVTKVKRPQKQDGANNPFGSPFGSFGNRRNGQRGGGSGGGGGQRGGGGGGRRGGG